MILTADRRNLTQDIQDARNAGARLEQVCDVAGIPMQKNLRPKAAVQTVNLLIALAPSQGARRASGDGAEAGPQNAPRAPNMEVVARATRRRFTNADRHRILAQADACTQPGEIGALLRREGVYSSSLATWRRQARGWRAGGPGIPKARPQSQSRTGRDSSL